jgi:myo-inositol-1-phosphate synthase
VEQFALFNENDEFTNTQILHTIETDTRIPKLGLMLVGWGGNNGSTLTAGILANKHKLTWRTKQGEMSANYYGSFT